MPEVSDTAVCLRCWDWSETSQTVALFGRATGLIRGLAKGSRRERSSFSGGFEPMTLGGVRAFPKAGSDLATLASWDLLEPWRGLRNGLRAHYAGCYLVDLIYHALGPEDPHPRLFDAMVVAIHAIALGDPADAGPDDLPDLLLDRVMLSFHAALLVDLGYQPDLTHPNVDHSEGAGASVLEFDPARGCLRGAHGSLGRGDEAAWRIRESTRLFLVDILSLVHADEPADSTHAGLHTLHMAGESLDPAQTAYPHAPPCPGPIEAVDADTLRRAVRFLVCHTGVVLARAVPSLRFVYPETQARIESWVAQ